MAKTLHYDFAGDKSLDAKVGPTLTFSRATDASYFDSAGVMQTAASGEARFDHDPVTGDSLGLLVEEARTNICLQSEDITEQTTVWKTNSNEAAAADQTTAPDGSLTADQLIDDSSTGTGQVFVGQTITTATSTAYCYSCFCKADQLDWVFLKIVGMTAQTIGCYFDLSTGTVGTPDADVDDQGIEDYGNGWYRCWLTFTSDGADTSAVYRIMAADADTDSTVDLDGTSSIFVWGASLEAGSFPTSYVKTVAASVTRNADVVLTTTVDWYSQAAGSFYFRGQLPQDGGSNAFNLNDGGATNRVVLASSTGAPQSLVTVSGSNVVNISDSGASFYDNAEHEVAFGLDTNDFAQYVDGTAGTPDTSGALPSGLTTLKVGDDHNGNAEWNGHIAEIAYFDERLDNDTLEDYSLNGIPSGGINYIAITRRTFNGPPKRIPYPKPKRGLFR